MVKGSDESMKIKGIDGKLKNLDVEDLLDYYARLAKRLTRILDKMESPSSPNISGMPSSSQLDTSRFDGWDDW